MSPVLFSSLRIRLLLLLLLIILPAYGLMLYTAWELHEKETRNVQNVALRLARLVLVEQRELFAGAEQLLPTLAELPTVRSVVDKEGCSRFLGHLLERYPQYANIGVINKDGLIRCSGLPLGRTIRLDDRRYFREALATREFVTGDYQIGRISGKSSVNFGYPMLNARGEAEGVVFAALDLAWLSRHLTKVDLPEETVVTILDGNGIVLARQPDIKGGIGQSIRDAPIIRRILAEDGEGTAEAVDDNGALRLFAFTPLSAAPGNKVYVSIGIPQAVAYAELNRIFKRNVVFLLLIATAGIAVAWIGSNFFVLRPFKILTHASQRLGDGDFSARTDLPSTAGELGRLGRTFDHMAESLQRRQVEIEQQDNELRRINRALQTLSGGNHALIRAKDEPSLLQEMCRVAVETGGYLSAWVGYAEDDGQKQVLPVAQFGVEEVFLKNLAISWDQAETGRGPTGLAVRTGKPHVARGLQTDPRYRIWHEAARKRGIHCGASLPLRIEDKVLGAMTIYAREPDAFDEQEMAILLEMSEDLAYGITTLRTRVEHKEAQATIWRMAYYDQLTGLPNHASFEQRLQSRLAEARSDNKTFALLMFDIDRLRDINDTLGFAAGNGVLQESGRRLQQALQADDFVARLRGDEFAVLLHAADADRAGRVAREMLNRLGETIAVADISLTVRANAGIVLLPDREIPHEKILRAADLSVQHAKTAEHRYAFYSPDWDGDRNRKRHLELAGDLQRALKHGELTLYYQPKVCMESGRVHGFEALARWPHPEHGMIPPDEFIMLSERTGMIGALTDWVLETALSQLHAWQQAGTGLPVAINLSARSLQDARLAEKIKTRYAAWNTPKGMLELEITESMIMEDPASALDVLSQLRTLGIPLYIDDFGTGYSSLSYLQKLPVTGIKIDKSFVIDMLKNKDSATIVSSTILLAHDLGLKVVAEGVENEAVWTQLASLSCDAAQGYYMARPMPAEEVIEWLKESAWGLKGKD